MKPEFTPEQFQNYIKAMFGTPPEQGGNSPKDAREEGAEDIEWRMRDLVQELAEKQKSGEALTQQELLWLQKAKKYLRIRVSDYYRELEDADIEDDTQE
jgi:L-lysine 2,3-aminomutase